MKIALLNDFRRLKLRYRGEQKERFKKVKKKKKN
jgi:hypothetical protein